MKRHSYNLMIQKGSIFQKLSFFKTAYSREIQKESFHICIFLNCNNCNRKLVIEYNCRVKYLSANRRLSFTENSFLLGNFQKFLNTRLGVSERAPSNGHVERTAWDVFVSP